jgi:hypothetical protein
METEVEAAAKGEEELTVETAVATIEEPDDIVELREGLRGLGVLLLEGERGDSIDKDLMVLKEMSKREYKEKYQYKTFVFFFKDKPRQKSIRK